MAGITLEIVKVKGSVPWAIKAVVDGVARYRGYYYKKEAVRRLPEWLMDNMSAGYFQDREFMHNFHSAQELGITEAN